MAGGLADVIPRQNWTQRHSDLRLRQPALSLAGSDVEPGPGSVARRGVESANTVQFAPEIGAR